MTRLVIKNNTSDFRFPDFIRYFKLSAQRPDTAQIKGFQPHIHRNRYQ